MDVIESNLFVILKTDLYTCFKNAVWLLFIIDIIICKFLFLSQSTRRMFSFGLYGIQICLFLQIQKRNTFLMFISLLSIKNVLNKSKKLAQQTSSSFKVETISMLVITLSIFLAQGNFEILYCPNQDIVFSKIISNNSPIIPLLNIKDNNWVISLGCTDEQLEEGRSFFQKSISISNCLFSRSLVFSGNGAVIYVSDGSYSMNVNYSMFYRCFCSLDGGAIWFSSSDSNLRMTCANNCSCGASSSYNCNFGYLQASQVNQVEYLSVSKCSHTTRGYYSICLQEGDQRAENTNSSMNNADYGSGISFVSPSSLTSSHNTFSNNNVSHGICIYFYSISGTIIMSYSNIVHNNSPFQYGVIFVSGAGSRKMMYCVIQNNIDYLFCVVNGFLEVSHSFIDHSSASYSYETKVSTETNNSFIKTQTYIIEYKGSLICKFPTQSQDSSTKSGISWISYSIIFVLFITLLAFLYFYRKTASNLLDMLKLEKRLQNDFG